MSANSRNNFVRRRAVQMPLILTLLAYPLLQGQTNLAASAARTMPALNKAGYAMADTSSVAQDYQPGDIKVLAEGFHSKITKPFIAVVRDAETYAALTRLDENLPRLDGDFFKENVAIAAFLGERNTGGYSVEIRPNAIEISVLEKKPGKGVMVPQMITSPFKVVALQGATNAAVRLTPDEAWRQATTFYRVTSGRFSMSGGFAGSSEEFGLRGPIGVMRAGKLATFHFSILNSGTSKRRLLVDSCTGPVDDENKIRIDRMSADSFVDPPNSGLSGTATFSDAGRKLTVDLLSRQGFIADGYSGRGTIEAELRPVDAKP